MMTNLWQIMSQQSSLQIARNRRVQIGLTQLRSGSDKRHQIPEHNEVVHYKFCATARLSSQVPEAFDTMALPAHALHWIAQSVSEECRTRGIDVWSKPSSFEQAAASDVWLKHGHASSSWRTWSWCTEEHPLHGWSTLYFRYRSMRLINSFLCDTTNGMTS